MSTPTITTTLLREATTGTNPAAEADLLAGARHIARSVARGYSRVDADDLAGGLITELITSQPVGLPGAAWKIAKLIAGGMNVVEQVAGSAPLGMVRRGANRGQRSGMEQLADGLGIKPDNDGRFRFPHSASITQMHEDWGYDPEAAPMFNREPTPSSQRLTEELIDRVAVEMGWSADLATRAVKVLAHALDGINLGAGHDLPAARIANQLVREDRTRFYAREACLPDRLWRAFVRTVFRDVLAPLATLDLTKAA